MHIELTEMLKCPAPHREEFLVLSTGQMAGRMVRSGLVGCPVCHAEYQIVDGVLDFGAGGGAGGPAAAGARWAAAEGPLAQPPAPDVVQALLDLSGPGGIIVLVGAAARHALGLAALMGGIHFVGVNAPPDVDELPVLSLLRSPHGIPVRASMARGVVLGADLARAPWLAEAQRVLLRGRRYVATGEDVELPAGVRQLARGQGLVVGEKT